MGQNGKSRQGTAPAIDLGREPEFALGTATVRPSSSAIVVGGITRRMEPRVMQVLVALAQANGAVISRDELLARCWTGLTVSEDAVTRAVGQVRRMAPMIFTIETIPKIGYRLVLESRQPLALASSPHRNTAPLLVTAGALIVVAVLLAISLATAPSEAVAPGALPASIGTANADAYDRYLRATGLLEAGGKDNALRAEQLLREALTLDAGFHAAKEALSVALLSVAAFVPERAGAAQAEIATLLDNEITETPVEWRSHVMRGFQLALEGDWLAAERALVDARRAAPASEREVANGLQIFLHGSVGRIGESLELMRQQARSEPLSHDRSRVLQQWLDRAGLHLEAEAEYTRSRDLAGDRSAMELAALVRALGGRDAATIEERFVRYRETDWGRTGDDALYAVRDDRSMALESLRAQITGYTVPGAMPPFLAAAWASYYGDNVLAVEGLRASPESLFATAGLLWDPIFAEARGTAAFKELVLDLGYVGYWRETGEWGDFCRPLGADDFECSREQP